MNRGWKLGWWMLLVGLTVIDGAAADPAAIRQWTSEAQAAFGRKDHERALALMRKVLADEPESAQAHYFVGRIHEERREHAQAIESYSMALRFDPKAGGVYQRRGCEHFRAGRFRESLDDFDRFLELAPQQEAHHWQRGISYFYAGLYEKGRRQFELHQTVNPNDVENSVWHFLCMARERSVEEARKAYLPVSGDRRVPMTEISALFSGKGTEAEVLKAVSAGEPGERELKGRRFYADLYLGVYYDVLGDREKARLHMFRAAEVADEFDYMGDVARVHAAELRKREGQPPPRAPR